MSVGGVVSVGLMEGRESPCLSYRRRCMAAAMEGDEEWEPSVNTFRWLWYGDLSRWREKVAATELKNCLSAMLV